MEALHELESGADTLGALVTDIRLGDGNDGWQVARRARELRPLLPVVYMSGDSAVDHASQGVPHSIMVQKPFAAAQIVTAVSTLINKLPSLPSAE
jgi:DNA-binding NtrC family response regulator